MKYIGLDVGNGSTCIYVRYEDGTIDEVSIASTFGYFDDEPTAAVAGKTKALSADIYTLGGRQYALGYKDVAEVGTEPIGTYSREDRIHLGAYQKLVKLALLMAATMNGDTGVIEVALGFGVPNEDYRDEQLGEITKWFAEPTTGGKNGQQLIVTVKQLELVSQPIAVLLDAYYDQNGTVRDTDIEKEDTLVIDSGSGTLDMTELRGFRILKQTSKAAGMNDVYKLATEYIERREPKVRVNPYDLEQQIRSQIAAKEMFYRYGRIVVSITAAYQKAIETVWDLMVNSIEREYPNRTRFHRVQLAGGTGEAFYSQFVKWMPQIEKSPDPQMAIARGLCKYVISLAFASVVVEVSRVAEGEVSC